MRKDRLLKLAEFLETYKFNRKEKFNLAYGLVKNKYCIRGGAIGWATILFKHDGFHYNKCGTPIYKNKNNLNAIMDFFGITLDDSMQLFSIWGYDCKESENPLAVAARIREFVKKKETQK